MNYLITLVLFIVLQYFGREAINIFYQKNSLRSKLMSFLLSPIIIFHELGHTLFAILFFQRIRNINFLATEDDGSKSGSVTFAASDSISASFVALGPLIISILLLIIGELFIFPNLDGMVKIIYIFCMLFITQVGLLSKKDWLVGSKGLIILCTFTFVAILVGNQTERDLINKYLYHSNEFLQYIFLQLCIINISLILFFRIYDNVIAHLSSSPKT